MLQVNLTHFAMVNNKYETFDSVSPTGAYNFCNLLSGKMAITSAKDNGVSLILCKF